MRVRIQLILLFALFSAFGSAQGQGLDPNETELRKNWSLFSEYAKNLDFRAALPYAWRIHELNPTRFRTLYTRLADVYVKLAEQSAPADRKALYDTLLMIYNFGMERVPERATDFLLLKGYALESYFEGRELEAIAAYEAALTRNFDTVDYAYKDRLGSLYLKQADHDPEYRIKALDLFRKVLERDPSNQFALDRVRRLATDPEELIAVFQKQLEDDPNKVETIWNLGNVYFQTGRNSEAEEQFKKLTKTDPSNLQYWDMLIKTQFREGKFRDAIRSNEQVLKIKPDQKENLLNIAQAHRQLENFQTARQWAQRAIQADKTWGRPHVEIGEIYKSSVEDCIKKTKGGDWGKLDINDKLVYKLAEDSFRRAKQVDESFTSEAEQRIKELSTLVPTKEDYFFFRSRITGNRMALEGSCYRWIGEAVPVPTM